MNDDELQRELLNEVPTPPGGYWDRIDSLLTRADDPADAPAASRNPIAVTVATNPEVVADITSTPALDGSSDNRQNDRRRAWRWPAAAAAAALLVLAGWVVGNAGKAGNGPSPVTLAAQPNNSQDSQPEDGQDAAQPDDTQPDASQDGEAMGPRANLDHWNSVYAVWDCTAEDGAGAWLPAFASNRDDHGIHSHGGGLISIHPFSEASAGINAQFGLFAESMGIEVAVEAITLDDGRRLEAGTECNGEPAVVHLRRWQYDFQLRSSPALAPTVVTRDFYEQRFLNDREVWVIALAPLDADLPLPPQHRFNELDEWGAAGIDLQRETLGRRLTPPPADIYVQANNGLGPGRLAQDLHSVRLRQNEDEARAIRFPRLETDGISHLATVQTGRALDIFRSDSDAPPYCLSIFSATPSSPGTLFTCGSDSLEPGIEIVRDGIARAAVATYAPEQAEWMLIEAQDDIRIVTEVVDGVAFAEWPFGEPVTITFLDAAMETVLTYEDF